MTTSGSRPKRSAGQILLVIVAVLALCTVAGVVLYLLGSTGH
jgi:hypothetical protein